jgi:serine/threonine protein kinase
MAHNLIPGYRWLYEYPKILHRDISLYNLMLRKDGDKVYGVLNDFDLSVRADIMSPSSKHRTGTQPFMAIDLLTPNRTVHMYRHDLESMFYVLVWITSRFDNGEEIPNPPLQYWADHGGTALYEKKTTFILSELPFQQTAQFKSLRGWIFDMKSMIHDGLYARNQARGNPRQTLTLPKFEDETLGGLVTFDKFQAVLDAELL